MFFQGSTKAQSLCQLPPILNQAPHLTSPSYLKVWSNTQTQSDNDNDYDDQIDDDDDGGGGDDDGGGPSLPVKASRGADDPGLWPLPATHHRCPLLLSF